MHAPGSWHPSLPLQARAAVASRFRLSSFSSFPLGVFRSAFGHRLTDTSAKSSNCNARFPPHHTEDIVLGKCNNVVTVLVLPLKSIHFVMPMVDWNFEHKMPPLSSSLITLKYQCIWPTQFLHFAGPNKYFF